MNAKQSDKYKKASATLCRTGFLFNVSELTERFNEKVIAFS
ncbi:MULTISPECIES: hypothetical protein [Vibrio]|nr:MULTISPECIES: hypothetical protein [Vibrio]